MLRNGGRPLESEEQAFFQELYQNNYGALFGYAYHLGIGREAAEDYVQDAFLTALRHIEDVKSSPNPRGYLQQVLKNVIGYQLRCMRYAVNLRKKLQEREPPLAPEEPVGDHLPPEMLFSGAVSDEELRLLIRFYLEGWSQKELAGELGISLNACKKRIQRAKERLRRALEEENQRGPEKAEKKQGGGSPQRRSEEG